MQLETDRLIIREFQQKDLKQLAPILANPKVMRFSPTSILSVSQTRAKIESFIASYRELNNTLAVTSATFRKIFRDAFLPSHKELVKLV